MPAWIRNIIRFLSALVSVLVWGAIVLTQTVSNQILQNAPLILAGAAITGVIGIIPIPIFLAMKMLTGVTLFGYLAALWAIFFTLLLGLVWSPLQLLIGTLLGVVYTQPGGTTHNPLKVGRRYVRFVGILLFSELMATIFVLTVPFHKNIPAIPIFLVALAAIGLGTAIWGGRLTPRFYVGVAILVALLATASFFLPETFGVIGDKMSTVDHRLACVFDFDETRSDCPVSKKPLTETYCGDRKPVGFIKLNAGQDGRVAEIPAGKKYAYCSNKSAEILSREADGSYKTFPLSKGWSSWDPLVKPGFLRVKALEDDTEIGVYL